MTYNINEVKPKLITLGVSLITHEVEHLIMDNRHVEIPVDDAIHYLTIPYSVAFLPNGGASYDIIADLLEAEGYPRRIWWICNVWECVANDVAEEIF